LSRIDASKSATDFLSIMRPFAGAGAGAGDAPRGLEGEGESKVSMDTPIQISATGK
jgi:hypothetical protein